MKSVSKFWIEYIRDGFHLYSSLIYFLVSFCIRYCSSFDFVNCHDSPFEYIRINQLIILLL